MDAEVTDAGGLLTWGRKMFRRIVEMTRKVSRSTNLETLHNNVAEMLGGILENYPLWGVEFSLSHKALPVGWEYNLTVQLVYRGLWVAEGAQEYQRIYEQIEVDSSSSRWGSRLWKITRSSTPPVSPRLTIEARGNKLFINGKPFAATANLDRIDARVIAADLQQILGS